MINLSIEVIHMCVCSIVALHMGDPFEGPPLSASGSQLEGTLFEAASPSNTATLSSSTRPPP